MANVDVNLYDPAFIAEPYPVYEQIRAAGRVVWNGVLHAWMVPGFDDCTSVLADDGQRFATMTGDPEVTFWFDAPNMIMVDGAEHKRLRAPLAPLFRRPAIAVWETRVGEVVDELLAPLIEGQHDFDLIADFTMIPTVIVAEMLGVPRERHEDFRRWSRDIASNISFGHEDPAVVALMHQAADELRVYLSEEIARHRRDQPDDILTKMIQTADQQGASEAEIRSTAILLLLAGYETTAKLMATSLVVLEQHPDQRRLVAADPALVPAAIEEVLRWASISQATPRRVVHDTTFAGEQLRAGDELYALHAAANRDPARWREPHRFDVRRTPKAHHGFGYGPHLCLGASLARLETKVALERLLRIAPDYELRGTDFGHSYFARGPERGSIHVPTAAAR